MDPDLISDTGDTLVIVSYIFTACPGCPGCFIFFCWLNQSTPWPIRPWRISPATVLGFSRRVFGGFYPSKLWWFAMFSPSKLGLTIKNWPSKFSKFPPAKSLAKSCFFSDSGHLENLGLQQEKATNEHGWAGVICHYFLLPQNGTAIYQRMTSGIELHGKSTRNGESHSFFFASIPWKSQCNSHSFQKMGLSSLFQNASFSAPGSIQGGRERGGTGHRLSLVIRDGRHNPVNPVGSSKPWSFSVSGLPRRWIFELLGGLVAINFIFPLILGCCPHPNWLSYFSEGFKPPTS